MAWTWALIGMAWLLLRVGTTLGKVQRVLNRTTQRLIDRAAKREGVPW